MLRLDPGSWTLTLTRPGYEPARRAVQLVHGRAEVLEVTMALERPAPVVKPPPPAPRVVDAPERPPAVPRRLMLGLAVGGGAMAVAGTGLLARGVILHGSLATCDASATRVCQQDLAKALRLRDAGSGVLGAGIGVLAGALTWISADPRIRRRLWIAEAAIGSVALIGGAAGLTTSSLAFNKANAAVVDNWEIHFATTNAAGHAAAAGMFGLGAGLVLGAGTGLIVQRTSAGKRVGPAQTLRLDPAAGPRDVMLRISGRF